MSVLVTCGRCLRCTRRKFPLWAVLSSVVFFPLGLLALLVGRHPLACPHCHGEF